ncbi:MAG: hypothetical protein L6R19_24535 [Alphaproteobacteria bacterium]|nr:hypothetical protein [Alphaproteobacteria bacterium]
MKPDRKLEIVAQAIQSLATHDDEDAAVIEACLDQVIALCEREKGALAARVAARIGALLGGVDA